MSGGGHPTCEFVTDEDGVTGVGSEEVQDDGTVVCTAGAERVIRLKTGRGAQSPFSMGRRLVCNDHAVYLVNEAELHWEHAARSVERELEIRQDQ